jgi:predicted metal-dependent HD superfamily phosphohydrolase
MSSEKEILKQAESEVRKIFKEKVDKGYTYHNIQHTLKVFHATRILAKESGLDEAEITELQLASLFHDTGFTEGPTGHEERSAATAREYLKGIGYPEDHIKRIEKIILATRKHAVPNEISEEIIRDADLSGLADPLYQVESKALKEELAFYRGYPLTDIEWHNMNYQFIKNHNYHTEAAQKLYDKGKKTNLKAIKKMLESKINKKPSISTSKSAQTQFKTALRNHIDLSAIADNKANIMLSVNALIITVALPVLAGQILENNYLLIPGIMLLVVCVTSMIYATLATRPIKMSGYSSLEDVKSKKSNLFFFGNFYKMKYDEYEKGIMSVLSDHDILDNSITRDLFFLGKSLGSKYSRLRKCYNIFMYGITIVVIAFVIAYILSKQA